MVLYIYLYIYISFDEHCCQITVSIPSYDCFYASLDCKWEFAGNSKTRKHQHVWAYHTTYLKQYLESSYWEERSRSIGNLKKNS